MKKSLIITCNAITVFFLNFIYYVCSYYPKHIVEFSSWESVFGVLWNLLFYFLLFSILIIAFKKDKTIFSSQLFNRFSPIMERFEITLLLKLFAVQMAVDFVYLLSAIYLKEYTGFIGSVLTLAGWFAIYFVATKNKLNLLNNKKYFVWTLITCALVFAIAICLDYRILDTFICYTERYQANSAVLQNAITNIDNGDGTYTSAFASSDVRLRLGHARVDNPVDKWNGFIGRLGDLKVYDYAMTKNEVSKVFNV